MHELSLVFPDPLWHPSCVSARAQLFGVPSAMVEEASVLELDCADGGNILSIAASMPRATCVGLAASAEALRQGQNLLAESQLTNVSLSEEGAGIEGTFDYIFLRNTFSRLEPDQRKDLISYYRSKLNDNGILVVEQLCLPGWHYLKSIRDQIRYHTRNIEDAHEKMIAGRQYLSALAQSIPASMAQYRNIAQGAWETSNGIPDVNFGIEYFDENRHPSFFHEFGAALEGSGLQYLCELSLGSMLINQFPAAMGSLLPGDAGVIESEQYLDFVTNRTRRVSLLCSDQIEVTRQIEPSVCQSLYFSSAGMPNDPEEVFREEKTLLTSPYGGTITISNPAAKAAMLALSSRFPKRLSLPEVLDIVKEVHSEFNETDEQIVLETFTACAVSEIVQIDAIPGRAIFEISETPVASALIRAQAKGKVIPYVSSLQHRSVSIDLAASALLEMLDGSNGKDNLIGTIRGMIEDGSLVVKKDGDPVTDPDAISEAAEQQTEALLAMFAANGLLQA